MLSMRGTYSGNKRFYGLLSEKIYGDYFLKISLCVPVSTKVNTRTPLSFK